MSVVDKYTDILVHDSIQWIIIIIIIYGYFAMKNVGFFSSELTILSLKTCVCIMFLKSQNIILKFKKLTMNRRHTYFPDI